MVNPVLAPRFRGDKGSRIGVGCRPGRQAPGAYTVQLTDMASRRGGGLLEVYRADDAVSRLVNLSSRGFAGTGSCLANQARF